MTRSPTGPPPRSRASRGSDSVRRAAPATAGPRSTSSWPIPRTAAAAQTTVERMRAALDDDGVEPWSAGRRPRPSTCGLVPPARPVGDLPGHPGAGARGAARSCCARWSRRSCWCSPCWHLRRRAGRQLVAVHLGLRLQRRRRRDAAAGLPVPGRPRRRLQHLPGHPDLGGDPRARVPRRDAARPGGDRRCDHQRRHPAGCGLRGPRRAPTRGAGPARRGDLPRRAAGHPRRAHRPGPRPGAAPGRPVLVAEDGGPSSPSSEPSLEPAQR